MEPVRKKLRRWILGEKNQPPVSITEQLFSVKAQALGEENVRKLGKVFREADDVLHFGFGYKLLRRAYKSLGIELNEQEQRDFQRRTGYQRKLNQDSAGMTLNDFCEEIALLTAKLSNLEERDQLVENVAQTIKKVLPKQVSWEQKFFKRRNEIIVLNAIYKPEKIQKLVDMLDKNPEVTLSEIEKAMKDEHYGISIYEKTWLLKAQLAQAELVKRSYQGKLSRGDKIAQKLKTYEAIEKRLKEELAKQEAQLHYLFKKPMSEHYY